MNGSSDGCVCLGVVGEGRSLEPHDLGSASCVHQKHHMSDDTHYFPRSCPSSPSSPPSPHFPTFSPSSTPSLASPSITLVSPTLASSAWQTRQNPTHSQNQDWRGLGGHASRRRKREVGGERGRKGGKGIEGVGEKGKGCVY